MKEQMTVLLLYMALVEQRGCMLDQSWTVEAELTYRRHHKH